MTATFTAKFTGRCHGCDQPIQVGQQARYDDDQLVHADCQPREYAEFVFGRHEIVCATCFCAHAGDCY